VEHPDPVRLSDLVGYEYEREPVVQNAERFAAGLPANNALLYGERGTGKSSTVKALLNEFGDRGLRLIEVPKEHLEDFHELLAPLRDRRERFILYVDDLSFEEQETHYKALKAILEGGIEARPDNVILYATSNRRHLVRERFADRQAMVSDDDDVHGMDSLEEKLSLSDRFGIHVTFGTPNQERYLEIVESLAARRGIALANGELRSRALSWAQRQNGRSGRTARQFIDALAGELGMTRNVETAAAVPAAPPVAPQPPPEAPAAPPPSPAPETGDEHAPWRRPI
jgi:predicted AAA+ superfamily ATPase